MRYHDIPVIESLEARAHLSAAPAIPSPIAAPDLTAALTSHFPRTALPGSQLKASLRVANNGAALAAATIPVGVYVSDSPVLDDNAYLFADVPIHAALKNRQSKTFSIKFTLPVDAPAGACYLIFQVNDDGTVLESNMNNNAAASSMISNPVGEYSGTFTLPHMDPMPIDFEIDGADSSVLGNGDGGGLLDSLNLSRVSSKVTAAGKYTIMASGTLNTDAYGTVHFSISATGQIDGDAIAGTMTIGIRLPGGQSQTVRASFQVTRSDF